MTVHLSKGVWGQNLLPVASLQDGGSQRAQTLKRQMKRNHIPCGRMFLGGEERGTSPATAVGQSNSRILEAGMIGGGNPRQQQPRLDRKACGNAQAAGQLWSWLDSTIKADGRKPWRISTHWSFEVRESRLLQAAVAGVSCRTAPWDGHKAVWVSSICPALPQLTSFSSSLSSIQAHHNTVTVYSKQSLSYMVVFSKKRKLYDHKKKNLNDQNNSKFIVSGICCVTIVCFKRLTPNIQHWLVTASVVEMNYLKSCSLLRGGMRLLFYGWNILLDSCPYFCPDFQSERVNASCQKLEPVLRF